MTKAEIFRIREERRALRLNRFYRNDYVSRRMIAAALSFTCGYLLVVLMWGLYYAEYLMTKRTVAQLANLGVKLVILWACLLSCLLVLVWFVFRSRYRKARGKIKEYQSVLKQLDYLYEKADDRVRRESEEEKNDNASGFEGAR